MHFKKIFFLLFLVPRLASAQSYTTDQIKQAADNELRHLVGDTLFQSCKYLKKGYYSYKDSNNISHWQMLKKHKQTQGKYIYTSLSYRMNYKTDLCAAYDRIEGTIFIKLDNQLKLADKPDLRFIPEFITKHENCGILTESEALALAYKGGFKKGADLTSSLAFDPHLQVFKWTISNDIAKDSTLQKHYSRQTYIIDAKSHGIVNAYLTEKPVGVAH